MMATTMTPTVDDDVGREMKMKLRRLLAIVQRRRNVAITTVIIVSGRLLALPLYPLILRTFLKSPSSSSSSSSLSQRGLSLSNHDVCGRKHVSEGLRWVG